MINFMSSYNNTSSGSDALVHRFMEVGTDRTFVCRGDQNSPRHFKGEKGTHLQMKIYKRGEGDHGDEVLETVGTVEGSKVDICCYYEFSSYYYFSLHIKAISSFLRRAFFINRYNNN